MFDAVQGVLEVDCALTASAEDSVCGSVPLVLTGCTGFRLPPDGSSTCPLLVALDEVPAGSRPSSVWVELGSPLAVWTAHPPIPSAQSAKHDREHLGANHEASHPDPSDETAARPYCLTN